MVKELLFDILDIIMIFRGLFIMDLRLEDIQRFKPQEIYHILDPILEKIYNEYKYIELSEE